MEESMRLRGGGGGERELDPGTESPKGFIRTR